MPDAEYSFFKDVGTVNMTIKHGPDHSQTVTNFKPYYNYGQHASKGGRIGNYDGLRPSLPPSVQTSPPTMMTMDTEDQPNIERAKSAPAVVDPERPHQHTTSREEEPHPIIVDTFNELWTEALDKYKEKTGIDIRDRKNEYVQLFEDCHNSGDALAVLADLPVFKLPGGHTTWMKIKDSLKKVLEVVIVLNGVAAEVGSVALPGFGKMIFVGAGLLLKATKEVAKQSDTLEKLFSRLAAFLSRLEVRGKSRIQSSSKKIFVKILVELLNALAIATAMMNGKFLNKSKRYMKKLFLDEDEIEQSLLRLSELTEEETSMALAELAASRPDFEDLAKEVGGLETNIRGLASQIRSLGIGKLGTDELNQLSDIFQSNDRGEVLQILQVLKIENDGTQATLNHIHSEIQQLRKALAQHETNGNRPSTSNTKHDSYYDYANYGQQITGGEVDIVKPETIAPPPTTGFNNNPTPEWSPPMSPGSSGDAYRTYRNYGQQVTGGKVSIIKPRTHVQ